MGNGSDVGLQGDEMQTLSNFRRVGEKPDIMSLRQWVSCSIWRTKRGARKAKRHASACVLGWLVLLPVSLAYAAGAHADPILTAHTRCQADHFDASFERCVTVDRTTADGSYVAGQELTNTIVRGNPEAVIFPETPDAYRASATVRADFGDLGVKTTAAALNLTFDPVTFTHLATRSSQVMAEGVAASHDDFTIVGTSGPVRVRVDSVVSISEFHSSLSGVGAMTSGLIFFHTSFAPVNNWCLGEIQPITEPPQVVCPDTDGRLQVGLNLLSFEVLFNVGDAFTWSSSLTSVSSTIAQTPIGEQSASQTIEALDSAHSFFTVLTEGAAMNWASGHDYSVPSAVAVSEPGIYAMLGVGLGLIGWVRRRRKLVA